MGSVKKFIYFLISLLLICSFSACNSPKDKVLVSLGEYNDYVFYSEGGFQDYTDYAKYYYTSVSIEENEYLKKIQESDFAEIDKHLNDFENWIKIFKDKDDSLELVVKYDFNRNIIDVEDYIYIRSEEHTWDDGFTSLVSYDVYFFDTQTLTLYYFHNNI